jgi:dienelactone hydrolase
MKTTLHSEVSIPVGNWSLKGDLVIPPNVKGVIVFSHGSGSGRFSTRNQQVAKYLQDIGFGTLLMDLLTEEEDLIYYNRFDIDLLTKRLAGATEWLEKLPATKECRIGFFSASTGAASALRVAALLPQIAGVISRGGQPDLAFEDLHLVKAPVLLIVGSLDQDVVLLNKKAFDQLQSEKKLEIVDGATHLFEEPCKMEIVCKLAGNWFQKYLQPVEAIK